MDEASIRSFSLNGTTITVSFWPRKSGWKGSTTPFSCRLGARTRGLVNGHALDSGLASQPPGLHEPEESDFDVFLVSGLRNAQVLPATVQPAGSPFCLSVCVHTFVRSRLPSNRIESRRFVLTPVSPRERSPRASLQPERCRRYYVPYR